MEPVTVGIDPLTVAILVAVIAFVGTIVGTFLSSWSASKREKQIAKYRIRENYYPLKVEAINRIHVAVSEGALLIAEIKATDVKEPLRDKLLESINALNHLLTSNALFLPESVGHAGYVFVAEMFLNLTDDLPIDVAPIENSLGSFLSEARKAIGADELSRDLVSLFQTIKKK